MIKREAGYYWVQLKGKMRVMHTNGNMNADRGCGWFDPIYNANCFLDKDFDWIGERLIEPVRSK
jgi:hypothetical protein